MAKQTARDRLWSAAMKVTHRNGNAITADELARMAETSERSARDALNTMNDNGVLKRERKGREVRYVPMWYDFEAERWVSE